MPLTGLVPDQSPLAVHEVGELVALQESEGLTVPAVPEVGDAVIATTGTGELVTMTSLQPPQLLSSLDSVMTPLFVDELLSAQTRMDFVPVVFQDRETETDLVAPAPKVAVGGAVGVMVTIPPVPPGPAIWKM